MSPHAKIMRCPRDQSLTERAPRRRRLLVKSTDASSSGFVSSVELIRAHTAWMTVTTNRIIEVQEAHPRWCFTYQGESMRAVGSAWERSLRRAGIEASRFRDLRHRGGWHVMSGTSLQKLIKLGGWKSYEMVLPYAHLAPEHLSAAAWRIVRTRGGVDSDSTISLRQAAQRPTR